MGAETSAETNADGNPIMDDENQDHEAASAQDLALNSDG